MAKLASMFESARQEWETPSELFDPLNAEFKFTLDAAASNDNTKVAGAFLTREINALAVDWGKHTAWLNPPYGDMRQPLSAWVRKAFEESIKGTTVVALIPARTNTNWFHDLCLKHGEVRFLRGRPKFGGAKHGLPWPLCLVIFRALAPASRQPEPLPNTEEGKI